MKLFFLSVAVGCLAILPSCSAFLPTNLNFSDPTLSSLFCPNEMVGPTTDHKAITREALRREVRRFLLEIAPANSSITIPEDASLSQIFRAYYGPSASPARFIKAVNDIAWSNALTEAGSQIKFHASYHMEGERLVEGHSLLQGRYKQMIRTITVDKAYDFSRELFGASLNGIQDFYSQTTWVELGREGVLEGLGVPGGDLGELAGPDDPVCTNCSSTTGVCHDNVIPTGKLSSGYYEYTAVGAEGLVIPKPEGTGKCSHGGLLDASVTKEAIGGISKESSSPCFSPHHYLHQQAVELAITASEKYIKTIRDAIGNEHFTNLLNLYQGSALSIVIDVTASMEDEIETVKEEARLIVQNSHPEQYIFVPFGDPEYGPVTKTSDEDEFLEVLDAVTVENACCCREEKFWHGLQLALINTPDYSTIFCFTDAGGNDAELMDGVLALVAAKHCKVSVIYSYDNRRKGESRSCSSDYELSGVDELQHLAAVSGGLFLELNSFDINDIDGIMEEAVGESKVTIAKRDGVKNHQDFSFPIDGSIFDFDLVLYGHISEASLTDYLGTFYNLMDEDALNSIEGVQVISFLPNLIVIRFVSPVLGEWAFEADGTEEYSVSVSASSTLGLLTEFAELDLTPPRPGYVVVRGSPLAGEQYYVEVTLTGYLESHVESVSALKFVDTTGKVLSTVPYDEMVDVHFYILSEALPSGSFYIQVDGFLESGEPFTRLYPTMAQPVECLIDLLKEESVLSATPGQTTQAIFTVYNYGPEAKFQYTAIDEEEFITSWTPTDSTIHSMKMVNVTVDFKVPSTALPGTTSTITFTASSLASDNNVNTYITYYIVLDEYDDSVPPTCVSSDMPNCSGYDSEDTCSGNSWSVGATLQDINSGLLQVYSQPSGDLSLEGFITATTDPVKVTFTSSCCLREVTIVGVDVMGNVGYCNWDLGPLRGMVVEFVAEAVGESWVYLRWNVSEVRDDLNKYSILIDGDYTDNSRCPELVCYLNVTYLDPCSLHTFTLTPHYWSNEGVETLGVPLDTDATTLGPVPEAPTNPSIDYVDQTTTSLSWTPPNNPDCLDHFLVCMKMFGATEDQCETTSYNNITLEGLEACTVYHINITSVSNSGQQSEDSLVFDTNTNDAAPGAPQNLIVNNQTGNWVSLSWDNPLERASCVDRWMVSYLEEDARFQKVEGVADNYATVNNLFACVKYTFFVSGVSPRGAQGSTETTTTVMDEIEPTAVESVEATPVDATTVKAVWIPATPEECVHHYLVCITELITLTQICHNNTDLQDTFTDLEGCTDYEITVTSVAPSGRRGTFMYDIARTMDLSTGPPTNLEVTDITHQSAVVSFEPPLKNPLCVVEYDIEVEDVGRAVTMKTLSASMLLQQTLSGLDACTGYEVRVSAVTAYGLVSEKVNSSFTTAEDTPSAPRALTHITVTADQVQLRWFAPLMNPTCVVTYKLSWTNGSDSSNMDYTPSGHSPEVSVTVNGLESCSPYTFTVLAVTPLGDEGPSISHFVSTSC